MTAPPKIRAILFDAGGTLIHVDGERVCRAAEIAYDAETFTRAEQAAVNDVRAWILAHPESSDRERLPLFLDAILRRLGQESAAARLAAARRVAAEHRRANLWSRTADGAHDALEGLRERGYRLGVISNADGRVRGLLEDAGVAPLLEFILDSAEIGFEKPDPRIFMAASSRLSLPPGGCAYVGDIYEIDILGARAAGFYPILIGDCPAEEPVVRIGALEELLGLFAGVVNE